MGYPSGLERGEEARLTALRVVLLASSLERVRRLTQVLEEADGTEDLQKKKQG